MALAVSPWISRGLVDHTPCTQVSLLRTIEMILKLPALSQFDENATSLSGIFTEAADFGPLRV